MADLLRANLRGGDFIGRWGGDEFIVVIEDLGTSLTEAESRVDLFCGQLLEKLSVPLDIKGNEYPCSVSLGARIFNSGEDPVDLLINHADDAMYSAKRQGGGLHQVHQGADT